MTDPLANLTDDELEAKRAENKRRMVELGERARKDGAGFALKLEAAQLLGHGMKLDAERRRRKHGR